MQLLAGIELMIFQTCMSNCTTNTCDKPASYKQSCKKRNLYIKTSKFNRKIGNFKLNLPWQRKSSNEEAKISRPSIREGPEHRAIPASRFPSLTQRANHLKLQSQYHGFPPKPLKSKQYISKKTF